MVDTYPRIAALCRVLEDAGDMTPTATRLILKTLETPPRSTYEDFNTGARITIGTQQVTQHQPVFTQTGNITQAWCNCGWILESTNIDCALNEADRHVAYKTKQQNES